MMGQAVMRTGRLAVMFLLGLALMLTGCGAPAAETSDEPASVSATSAIVGGQKRQVVATTTLVADVVKQIAGDKIEVTTMLAPGVNPHAYEPTPQDVKIVSDAELIFTNGVGYEEFLDTLITNAGGEEKIAEVSQGVDLIAFEGEHEHEGEGEHAEGEHAEGTAEAEEAHAEDEHEAGASDPHVWFNPQNVKVWADTIEQKLSELDAANAETYKANAASYRARLDELDTWAQQQISQIPEANRKLVTDHDTFGYLAEHYGLELIGEVLPSVSSAAEPSAQQISAIQDIIRENNVPAVFVSSEVNASLSEQVAQDTGAKLVFVYVESLTEPGGEADTYETFMRYNISKIVEGLKGQG